MKAQEYFEKYFENAKAMFRDMLKEFDEIKKVRKPTTMGGLVGIVRELNDKWNSVAGRVERKFSTPVIKRNAVWNVLLSEKFGDKYPRKPD